jgi:hypothetical protein
MRRTLVAAAAALAAVGVVQSASAVWVDHSVRYMKNGYHRNADWPWPYICPDRVSVREPFAVMVNNGWRRQNLLGAHHFNEDATKLTTAGELRVRWILTQAPADRRSIFVERSAASDITSKRVATARDFASQITTDGHMPQVSETFLISEGRPASVVDQTNMRFYESTPPPVLPAASTTETGQ